MMINTVVVICINMCVVNAAKLAGIRKHLLENYDPDKRPEEEFRRPVNVSFEMKLQTFDGFDIKRQTLSLTAFNILKWKDPKLTWNVSAFHNVDRINVDNERIWTPDIILYNTALKESLSHLDIYKSKVTVQNDGQCNWMARATWVISCSANVVWFPLDTQECTLIFGSATYTKSDITVKFEKQPSGKDDVKSDTNYVQNGEWDITSVDSNSKNVHFSCCPESFSVVEYTIVMQRLASYYSMYILLPLVSLSMVFLLVFHIPPHAGERMGFGVTILLSITVYLLVISEKLPEKSDTVPMLGATFVFIFYALCLALVVGTTTMVLSFRTKRPPNFLLKLISKTACTRVSTESDVIVGKEVGEDKMAIDTEVYQKKVKENFEKKNYNEEWQKICRYLDKRFCCLFLALILFIPLFIALGL